MNVFIYLLLNVISFYQLNYCFLIFSELTMSIGNVKCCIKRHITSLKHSLAYSLYSHKQVYLDDKFGKVRESALLYLISMFCSCLTFIV